MPNGDSDNTDEDLQEIHITSDLPPPKRYAHFGKRRRSFTDEMFRCQYVDKISRSDLVCNSLLWKNRDQALREHLTQHILQEEIDKLDNDQVRAWYKNAKKIYLQRIPEDGDEDVNAEVEEFTDLNITERDPEDG